jgi:sulfonate transport system permease protein
MPAVAPAVVNRLRLGSANGRFFLVAAELIASSKGFLLVDSQNAGRTDIMLLAIALLGKLSDTVFAVVECRLVDSPY